MRNHWITSTIVCLLAAVTFGAEPRLCDVAKPTTIPTGAPKRSDVCFSSRFKRPGNARDPHDTFRSAADFHATSLVWVYTTDPKFIQQAHDAGHSFQATVNACLPDTIGGKTYLKGRMRDVDGNTVTYPWCPTINRPAACANSPAARDIYIEAALACIRAGADTLQSDDPDMNLSAIRWGGACYCDLCIAGFTKYLGKTPAEGFDYRDLVRRKAAGKDLIEKFRLFQQESTIAFHKDVQARIDQLAGRHIAISFNNYGGFGKSLVHDHCDYGMSELPEKSSDPISLRKSVYEAIRRNKTQIFTFVSTDITKTRQVIATTYALGSPTIVPWDVFLPRTTERYFGQPEDYSDLYAFIRAVPQYLDGYEDAAITGPGMVDDRYATPPLTIPNSSGQLYAFARALPAKADAPVVIHLLERATPTAATLTLRKASLFGDRPVQVQLVAPIAYDKTAHEQAQKSKDYSKLVRTTNLAPRMDGSSLIVDVPAVQPWGMLILKPR